MSTPVEDKRTDLVTVGSADIYINNIDVGHIKETVEVEFTENKLLFKPSNELGNVKAFRIMDGCEVRCRTAQLSLDNIKRAMGVTTSISASYELTGLNASFSWEPTSGDKFDSLTFGGAREVDEFTLKLVHTRGDGKLFVVILYKAIANQQLIVPFVEDNFTLHDLNFTALLDSGRAEGDQTGIMYHQVVEG
jgi:hypothetical protein